MNEEKAREIFEAWYTNAYGPTVRGLETYYLHGPNAGYYGDALICAAWLAFRAGLRAGLAVETKGSFW